jgi:chromosome segregation protein
MFWEMNNGRQVQKISAHSGGTLSFDYARNGEFVTSGRDRKVKLWKADFNLKKELPAFSELVVEVAITQDGKRLFTADWNGKIEAWDATTYEKLGEIASNPPPIAERILGLEKEIAEAPAATAAARMKLEAAQKAVADAKGKIQKITSDQVSIRKRVAELKNEKTRLGLELTSADQERTKLIAARTTRQDQLNQARERLEGHRAEITEAEEEVKTLDVSPLIAKEKALANEARRLRAKAGQDPENSKLEEQAAAAEKQLTAHQGTLTKQRERLTAAESRATQLNQQLESISSNVGAAQKQLTTTGNQLRDTEETRSRIRQRLGEIGPEAQAAGKRLAALEKTIKPAREAASAREKELAEPQSAFENAQARETALLSDLKFWRAAAVNARALVVTAEHENLKAAQDEDLASFSSIKGQVDKFRTELSQIETRKKELAEQLDQLTTEVTELKAAIDQRAPGLSQTGMEAAKLKARYQELRK